MIEVEIRAKINNKIDVQNKLKQIGAVLEKSIHQMDRIFGHEMFLDENKIKQRQPGCRKFYEDNNLEC